MVYGFAEEVETIDEASPILLRVMKKVQDFSLKENMLLDAKIIRYAAGIFAVDVCLPDETLVLRYVVYIKPLLSTNP